MVIKWDSIIRQPAEWNKDMDLREAFKVSATPYFQEVARRIGRDTLQKWMDSLSYGNVKTEGPIDSFWLNNTLKISPDEQLGLMKRLYFDQLPFRKSAQQTVRDLMIQEDNTLVRLSYKTGFVYDKQHNGLECLTGWIEENKHVYFFVTFVKSTEKSIGLKNEGLDITKDILTQYGFFKGKM